MSKKETFFILFSLILFTVPLYAEIKVGLLVSIQSNAKMTLLYHNIPVSCEPYGVIPFETMIPNAFSPKECSEEIEKFYHSHPHERHFARENLYVQQSYHFEQKAEGCILYANGAESYSEMLLREGLAVIRPGFDDTEWNAKFARQSQGAEKLKMGLYDTLIRKFCIKEEK